MQIELHRRRRPFENSTKLPFDIHWILRRVRMAVKPFPKAALFDLKERGYGSPFQQLVACVLSIRTLDEVSLTAALNLLDRAPTPAKMKDLSLERLDDLISQVAFHRQKAERLRRIASDLCANMGGELPCDRDLLLSLRGVGPKCANLVLGISCGVPLIGVDTHVHRIVNRWGYVSASSPAKTLARLEEKLPKRYWVDVNRLLVPFGKHICKPGRPLCSTCPVLRMCRQVGVVNPR